jgi:transposase
MYGLLLYTEDIQRLLWISGIGRLNAFTIFLELDGIKRFPCVKNFYSYCRLVPGAQNSGGRTRHGSSKEGNKYLKAERPYNRVFKGMKLEREKLQAMFHRQTWARCPSPDA